MGWGPFGDGQGEAAAAAAADVWFRRLGLPPTVITPSKHRPSVEALSAMIDRGEWTTVRGDTASGRGQRGVVTFRPDWKELEYATSLWRRTGGAVFVLEHPTYPIVGWAAVTGALTFPGWIRTPPVPPEEREALEDLKTAGYKGYSDEHSQRVVRSILEQAPALKRAGRPWVLSALIALGMRHDQVERLPALPGVVTRLNDPVRRGQIATGNRRSPPKHDGPHTPGLARWRRRDLNP